ncbi:MAG: oligopeptide/dipeptide ABC transporter ATP-binding protein, partial [Legionellaceae bacterium]
MLHVTSLTLAIQRNKSLSKAVDEVSFSLGKAETVALVGESGSGKSLASLALMRLLPSNVFYGLQSAVDLQGQDLLALPESLMRDLRGRRLAMIFQEPMTALNPVLTVGQQLAESVRRVLGKKASTSDIKARMIDLLEDVEMPEAKARLSYYPHQLSGGQKQRVVIAMALAGQPEVLIADEPTTALDVTVQAQILTLLKKIQQKHQMSMLLITHDLSVVRSVAQRVYVMYAGQLVESADVSVFFKEPLHPYSQQLLASLPTFSGRLERLPAIPGRVPALGEQITGCRFHPRCAHAYLPCSTHVPLDVTLENARTVRCHLYPEHEHPPELPMKETLWSTVPIEDRVVLSVQSLSVYFKSHKAVHDVSFDLKKGKTLALVGESGCGKSTVCRAILGLQPITHGAVMFEGGAVGHMHR